MNEPTADQLRKILDYSAETGVFTWKIKRLRSEIGDEAGCVKEGAYIYIRIGKKMRYAHRLAWLYVYGEHPSGPVDHIDGNGLNNRIANLRVVSSAVNLQNQRRAHSDNKTSGLLGVYFDRSRMNWKAQIQANNKKIHLGTFPDKESAHSAYIAAKREYHEGCTI